MRVLRRMEMEPESGSSWPARIRSRVDFPAPLGPIRPSRSPSEMPSEMFSNNVRAPKLLEREVQLSSRAIYSYLRVADLQTRAVRDHLGRMHFGADGFERPLGFHG